MSHEKAVLARRDRIIDAAVRVFAESGYRGATTRRIASEAGVNEVTIFRQFGSKDELIREAIGLVERGDELPSLPHRPVDPVVELTAFARQQLEHLFRISSLIRTCMGEGDERPEIRSRATHRPIHVRHELLAYMRRLQEIGLAAADADVEAAATTLMGALFSDAMGRDCMPEAYSYSIEEAPVRYVDLILRSVGMETTERARRRKVRRK